MLPPVERLLPHRPPMLLVDEIVDATEATVVCRAVIAEDFVFLDDGQADIAVCIELVAQAVGCLSGLEDLRNGRKVRSGMLVSCKTARFHADRLLLHDALTVSAKAQWIRDPFASFTGSVTRADELLAEVEIMVAATDDPVAAMKAFGER